MFKLLRDLLATSAVRITLSNVDDGVLAHLRALVFLLLRLRRLTRFFLHLALIFDNGG